MREATPADCASPRFPAVDAICSDTCCRGRLPITKAPRASYARRWGWAWLYAGGCVGLFLFITYLGSVR